MSPAARNVLNAVGFQLSAVVFFCGCLFMIDEAHGRSFWKVLLAGGCAALLITGLVFEVLAIVRLFRKWSWPAFLVIAVWLWGQVLMAEVIFVWLKTVPLRD